MRALRILGCLLLFALGFAAGAITFVQTQARPLPAVHHCESAGDCLTDAQVLGLVTSAGLHLAPGLLPDIVGRSPECVAIRNPKPQSGPDFVFFPTQDMRNLLDLAPGDAPYLLGCIALMRQVVDERGIRQWHVLSNGPGAQEIAYLHFHLIQDQ